MELADRAASYILRIMSVSDVKLNILAIETSCDETAIAFVECSGAPDAPHFIVHAHVISTQIDIHRPFGGVVPSLAKREHLKNLPIVLGQVQAELAAKGIAFAPDKIAVTVGPGLEPALWTGVNFAKELGEKMGVPVVGANHLEGHLFSNWLEGEKIALPAIVLLVSGGHTALIHMERMDSWEIIGETQDDAVGEAFDKVAKMLGLPYPGGPEVEKMAKGGNPEAIAFPRPMLHSGDYKFSFSGLKTAVLYYLKSNPLTTNHYPLITDICASFQAAAIDVLRTKAMRAVDEYGAASLMLCGGVAGNAALRAALKEGADVAGVAFHAPAMQYNTDNAVMIAAAAYLGKEYPAIIPQSNLNI